MQRAAIIVVARARRLRRVEGGGCYINSKRRNYHKYSPSSSSSLLSVLFQQQQLIPPCSSSLSVRYFATTDDKIDNDYQEQPTKSPQQSQTNTTPQQSNLLQYTSSILPPLSDYPPGTLSYTQLITISNCIDQWISRANRAHNSVSDIGSGSSSSFFGEQDVAVDSILKLVKRLIIERGGGQSLINTDDNQDDGDDEVVTTNILSKPRRNEEVTYEMFKLHSIIQYLNVIYANNNVEEFVRVILDIVTLFENEDYINNNDDDDGGGGQYYFAVPYKSIISSLCAQHTPHAAVTAQLVLHRFETRQLQQQQQNEVPTTESYNNIMSCWRKSSAVITPPSQIDNNSNIPPTNPQQQSHRQHQEDIFKLTSLLPYQHHTNPVSNILYQMIELYNSNPESMRRMKPNYISFNTAITSTSRDEFNNNGNGNDHNEQRRRRRSMGATCFEHLQNMLQYYNHGSDEKCAPDLYTFSTVLYTLGRSSRGGGGNNHSRQASNKVNNRPREDGDNDVDDADKACWILDKMLELSNVLDASEEYIDEGNVDKKISKRSYDYEFDVIPRNRHFNVVLTLLGNKYNITDETLQRAQRYVDIMEELEMQEDGDGGEVYNMRKFDNEKVDNPPPTYDDDVVLLEGDRRGYSQEQGFHGNDERTQFSMTRSAPDTLTYNTLINIAARCGKPEKAEEILNSMIKKSSSSNEGGGGKMYVKPDNISFNTVLSAWAKMKSKKGMDRAEEILHRMQEMANDDDSNIRPDRVSFLCIYNLSGLKLV